jgi:protease-4
VLGSDQIRREVERLARAKPVIAYMADVAASGGYMIAAAAHQIVSQATTLTGSIGVVGGKLSAGRLFERLGLKRHALRRGKNASFDALSEGWTASEREAMAAMLQAHYRHFIKVVADGRRLSPAHVEGLAEGRVWSGRAACESGLVDRIGGLSTALSLARQASPLALHAVVESARPQAPRVPRLPLRGPLAGLAALGALASVPASLALAPFDLQIR